MEESPKKSFINQLIEKINWLIHFITDDIWRITENEMSSFRHLYINIVKTGVLAVRGFIDETLSDKAAILTYHTVLSIVPMLAVFVGIANGFGAQKALKRFFYDYIPGHQEELNKAFEFVNNYLEKTKGGIFFGIGLVLLFYTVISLLSTIESQLNNIWQIRKSRNFYRKITNYLALVVILPIVMTLSSGLSIITSSIQNSFLNDIIFNTPIIKVILLLTPFLIISLLFTFLYIALPNTKVKFINGLIAGIIAGIAFQFFQFLYISGQIWVSKYNAIYGSFAAIPLLLLWLQLSWLIILFGAQISFAAQNVSKFYFEKDCKNISRRYKDFFTLLITSHIIKRFEKDEPPYTADQLSEENQIPIRLTMQILDLLICVGIINEVSYGNDDRVVYYKPSLDINKISVAFLLDKIDKKGSEDFKINTVQVFNKEWQILLQTRESIRKAYSDSLVKDL